MNTRIIKWMLLSIAGFLAAMGLLFTWKCPVDCIFGVDSGVFFFKKQLLCNVIGIAACIGAALVPWRKWLKLAPWGMLAWFALAVWAVGFSPARHGSLRWADFGVVCVNIRLVLVLAWALFTAWLCSKKYIKPWMIFAVIGVSPSLAGYGGALTVVFWGCSGILFSLLSDDEECVTVSRRKTIAVCGFFGAIAVFFLLGMAVSGGAGLKYHAPIVRTGHLGEFGTAAKRGAIYAADGSVLSGLSFSHLQKAALCVKIHNVIKTTES